MPTIRATRSSAWSRGIRPNPNVPVGPVTATVSSLSLLTTPACHTRHPRYTAWMPRSCCSGGAGADGGDFVEGDAGGYAGVEGFGAAGDGNADQDVAGPGDDTGQATALGADDQDQRGGGQFQVADWCVAGRVQAGHEDAGVLVGGQGAGQVGGAGHRDPGQRARRGLP